MAFLLIVLVACSEGRIPLPAATSTVLQGPDHLRSLPRGEVRVSRDDEILLTVNVTIAATNEVRRRGLMFVRNLPEYEGMVFLWPGAVQDPFYMKNTLIPLDIAFWNERMQIVQIHQMTPCKEDPCPLYPSPDPYVGALEVNRGVLGSAGVEIGDTVNVTRR